MTERNIFPDNSLFMLAGSYKTLCLGSAVFHMRGLSWFGFEARAPRRSACPSPPGTSNDSALLIFVCHACRLA